MEIISIANISGNIANTVRRVHETQQPVEIADESGQIIAQIVPAEPASDGDVSHAWTELDRQIRAITPYLPEHVDAVEAVREIRG